MASEYNFVDYDKYENWIAVVVGLSLTVKGLQDYCHGKLSSLHNNIKLVVNQNNLTDCNQNCSKRYKNNFQNWCMTCSRWKYELEIHNRDRIHWRGIKWSKINSIDWKHDLEEIAKVFMNTIPDCSNTLEDLGPILSVFRNCDEFHISDQVIMAVSTVRNKYYAHFYQLKLSRYEKERCMDSLIDLLSVPEVQIIQSAKWITQTLQRVKRAQYITKDIIDSKTKQHVIMLIGRRIREIKDRLQYNSETRNAQNFPQENDFNFLRKRMDYFDTSPQNNVFERIRQTVMSKLFLLVCIVILAIFMFPKVDKNYMEGQKHGYLNMYCDEFGNGVNDFYRDYCSLDRIPTSQTKLFRSNLERIFGVNGERFQIAKSFFEILCVSKYPLNLETLLKISGIAMESTTARLFVRREMKNFLHYSNGLYSLIHESLKEYFLSLRNDSPFCLDFRKGHAQIGKYLLYNDVSSTSLVDIAFHVAYSEDLHLEERFKELSKTSIRLNATSVNRIVHHIAQSVNSYRTVQLLLHIMVHYNMDTRDSNDETAAFVAAAHGNYETLRCFLDNGAHLEFEKYIIPYSEFYIPDLISECKYVYFCGYNMLEISSQNGHIETVKMLLKRNKHMLSHKTSFGLNALELAVENGHVAVVNYLLTVDKSVPNLHSLYLAAENGHAEIVELLLKHNVTDVCIPCNKSLYWLPAKSIRAQKEILSEKMIYEKHETLFLDDWRLIMCESALHAAVRHCHLEVVEILVSKSKQSIECIDRSGMTPIQSAIKYNCSSIFETLFELEDSHINKRCLDKPQILNSTDYLTKNEHMIYQNIKCPKGAKIDHLLAMFSNVDIIKILYRKNLIEFDIPDDEGLTPLHYSACNRDSVFYGLAVTLSYSYNFNFLAKSTNGSTLYHSAAYCKSVMAHLYSYKPEWLGNLNITTLNRGIPDVLDNDNRSIVHYFFLGIPDWTHANAIIRMYFDNNINMTRVDRFGRNFLHYAVKFGNIDVIKYVTSKMSDSEKATLLNQNDINGRTPMHEIFHNLPFDCIKQKSSRIPNCKITSLLLNGSHPIHYNPLEPGELFVLQFINEFKRHISMPNLTEFMYIAANHSSVESIAILYAYYPKEFYDVLSNYTKVNILLHVFRGGNNMPLRAVLLRLSVLHCNACHANHLVHESFGNYTTFFWTYAKKEQALVRLSLLDIVTEKLDKCFDKEGYNLLHRASVVGDSNAINLLINIGMNISVVAVNNEHALDVKGNDYIKVEKDRGFL